MKMRKPSPNAAEFNNIDMPHWQRRLCSENTCWNRDAIPGGSLCSEHELMFWALYGIPSTKAEVFARHGVVWDSDMAYALANGEPV